MKVLTRRNAALKNTAVTSRAIRASVINRRNSEKIERTTVLTKSAAKEIIKTKKEILNGVVKDTSSNTTTEKTKENVKPRNTGKKRGRPFKSQPTKALSSKRKLQTQTNGTSNHTANKAQTKETRSTRLVKSLSQKGDNCDTVKTNQKTPNSKTRGNSTKKVVLSEQTPDTPTSSGSPTVSSSEEKSVEKNNNETIAVLTKGPFSGIQNPSDTAKKNNKKYQCGICMKVFLGSNDLRKHLRIHR